MLVLSLCCLFFFILISIPFFISSHGVAPRYISLFQPCFSSSPFFPLLLIQLFPHQLTLTCFPGRWPLIVIALIACF